MSELKITDVRSIAGDSAFLIDDGKTAILYDTGFAFTGYEVAKKIKAELGSRALDYIFLTHSHYDHALGSVYVLKYWPEAKVVAGEYAAKIFAKDSAKQLMRTLDKKFAEKCGITEYEDLIDGLRVDLAVKDGDTINAGDMTFTAVALPGHTKCSVAFYLNEKKLLLGAETPGIFDGKELIFPTYLVGYQMTIDSIDKLLEFDIENILIPHFGVLDKETTRFYLSNVRKSTIEIAEATAEIIKKDSKESAAEFLKQMLRGSILSEGYPPDALELNTSIMVGVLENELVLLKN